ncbi:helix-turn-helix transcriptional regulator [Lentzea sp. BCCO 10_0061]|uniref:Helix-turn-helix transcriptional regulator n=1 Tax=Lentzea sokolovensis TaxID=3095429 RepID=A0ABU4V010_9PSEU|nr:helix-turn-helix transcriptional regulator [Lentzea sp. BCCO 10_0061]MDX8144692.1 helix-turn-helix transcriptional regulator [Lentzea sp. BCCO 10_0061]
MSSSKQRCRTCDTILASDRKGDLCGRCEAAHATHAPVQRPDFWLQPSIQDALRTFNIGQVFRAYRQAHSPTLPQSTLAAWLDITQGQVSVIERGRRPVTDLERLERWCNALRVPHEHRWFRAGYRDAETQAPQEKSLSDLGLAYAASLPTTVEVVAELGRHDMERRTFLSSALFSVAASVAPSRDWLLATLDEATTATGKISTEQVQAIRRTFGVFQELDVMRGGGHAREQLASYLTSHVVPLLKSNDPETPNGAALYEAAAEQLYLLGWMAFDNGEHALAQRYLIQSLRLAEAAGSPDLGAHVLAGLSDQATLTGEPEQAVQLAKAGRAGLLAKGNSTACLADLYALQARAEAAMGDGKAAAKSVHLSETTFENVSVENEPEWARFIDPAYLNGEHAHTFRDLERPDEAAHFAGLSIVESERQNRARRGSMAQAALARSAIDAHDLDVAASAGMAAAKLAATVKSSRSVEAVADLRARLRSHSESPAVRDFLDVSGALLPSMGPRP